MPFGFKNYGNYILCMYDIYHRLEHEKLVLLGVAHKAKKVQCVWRQSIGQMILNLLKKNWVNYLMDHADKR